MLACAEPSTQEVIGELTTGSGMWVELYGSSMATDGDPGPDLLILEICAPGSQKDTSEG